jgi:hypothetical protein
VNKSTRIAAVAALAVTHILIAGCSAGGPTVDSDGNGGGSSNGGSNNGGSGTTVAAPTFTAQPADATALTGASATFTATAGGSGVTYQWHKNGVPVAGATAATYTTPGTQWSDDNAQFTVVATNAGGSTTSSTAILRLALSDDQAAYERFLLDASGLYDYGWALEWTGAQHPGIDYLQVASTALLRSPLNNGPQLVSKGAPVAATASLPVVHSGPSRVLKNGTILVIPGEQYALSIRYVAGGVQEDNLAADGKTIAYSELRSDIAVHALAGTLAASPAELQHNFGAVFENPAVLDQTHSWAAGAEYLTFHEVLVGDRTWVYDCNAPATTGADPTPCASATTLQAALASGLTADGKVYHLADGALSTIDGLPVWIATAKRPYSMLGTAIDEYRVYFQMKGNVYTGSLTRDGAAIGGNHYRTDPADPATTVYLDYRLRLNKSASDSLAAAVKL